jgi:hypothetical protein
MGAPAVEAASIGPVAVAPTGRWMFLVAPGESLRPELAAQLDVVLHGVGSWVPAPPTRTPAGPIRWRVSPAATNWQLPDAYAAQRLLLAHCARVLSRPAPTAASRMEWVA